MDSISEQNLQRKKLANFKTEQQKLVNLNNREKMKKMNNQG